MEHKALDIYRTKEFQKIDKEGVLVNWFPNAIASIEECGGRSQTDYMDKQMVIGERPTEIGQALQCLKQISKIKSALQANEFNMEIVHVRSAVKRLVNFVKIYRDICVRLGTDIITDEMIEANEPEEKMKTMFKQGLRALASGNITEGDFLYGDACEVSEPQLEKDTRKFLYVADNVHWFLWYFCFFWVFYNFINRDEKRDYTTHDKRDWLEEMWVKHGQN